MCHHDHGRVPTPNMCWHMVRDALAHAVWPRGDHFITPVTLLSLLNLLDLLINATDTVTEELGHNARGACRFPNHVSARSLRVNRSRGGPGALQER